MMKNLLLVCLYLLISTQCYAGVLRHVAATGQGAMSESLTIPARETDWYLTDVRVHTSSTGASENFVVYIDSATASAYDVVLFSQNMLTVTDVVYLPVEPVYLKTGDVLRFTYTNSGSDIWGLNYTITDGQR